MTQVSIDDAFQWARRQHMAGRLAEAEKVYRQILQQLPQHANALHYLGVVALQVGRHAEALSLLRRSLELRPNVPDFHHNTGLALQEVNQLDESISHFRRAIELSPRMRESINSLATALNAQGKHDEAIAVFYHCVEVDPNYGISWNNLGSAEMARGNFVGAERALRKAAELIPFVAGVHGNLANLLLWSGQIDEALIEYRKAIELQPTGHVMWSNLLMALHYHPRLSPGEILREHRAWNDNIAAKVAPVAPPLAPSTSDPRPDRRLRVGYISADFRDHPIAFFIAPILQHLDRSQFEVFCYVDVPIPDDHTRRLSALADHWRPIANADSDEQVARLVRQDRIDILVDLGAHTAYNRLLVFARRAAPVQMTYLGYCATTGLDAMDYRITDAIVDPLGAERHGSEALIRLDRVFCAYTPALETTVAPAPAASNGHVTFGSLCTLAKVNEQVIALWARVLHAVPGSRLFMRARVLDSRVQQRFKDAFATHGVDADRLELLNHCSLAEYFQTFGQIDIALDPFPFSAHTTSCHALWMGVPVVTLTGESSVSRVSASILNAIGLGELVAATPQQYIDIAGLLAADIPRLSALRAGMRDRLAASPLLDGSGLARSLGDAYRRTWQAWLARTQAKP